MENNLCNICYHHPREEGKSDGKWCVHCRRIATEAVHNKSKTMREMYYSVWKKIKNAQYPVPTSAYTPKYTPAGDYTTSGVAQAWGTSVTTDNFNYAPTMTYGEWMEKEADKLKAEKAKNYAPSKTYEDYLKDKYGAELKAEQTGKGTLYYVEE